MKQLQLGLLALIFYASPGQGQSPAKPPALPANHGTVSVELVTLTKTWTDAMNAKDHVKLEALMDPEFALYRWNGELVTQRSDWLDFLYHTDIKEYTLHNISARAYGDFGVVTSVCIWNGVHAGEPFDVHSVMVDTWVRRDGRWQVITRNSCTPTPTSAGGPDPCPVYHYSR